ncbi:MAG: twin-arginine translocase subunit TatC [Anaerolineae bacterium]|nr:twin-arginine translocase subunit TatC [Anaerolineae bacterium]
MRKILSAVWRALTAPFRLVYRLLAAPVRLAAKLWRGARRFFTEEPEDTPITETFSKAAQKPGDFFQAVLIHLGELRWHLMRVVLFLSVTTGLALVFISEIIDWLATPIGGVENLQGYDITEPVGVTMRVAMLAGISIGLPYIFFEILLFAAYGLSRRARITGLFAIPLVSVFFVSGMAFAYYYMLPAGLPVLLKFGGIAIEKPSASSYISLVATVLFWIGFAFQFPLISYALASMGIIKGKLLRENWRIAVVLLSIAAAAITPTVDPINMLIVLIPLLVLYFMSMGLAQLAQKRRAARLG